MAAAINIPAYSDALVVLATAGVVVPVVQRWGVNPVLGYLVAGALLGPLGLGSFIDRVPLLYWFTVVDAKNVAGIADLGVVFLLFLIGLELSLARLTAMRRLVLGLGSLQIALSTVLLASLLAALGLKPLVAVLLGVCLALSSTAIVLEILSSQGRLTTASGRTSFAVLLAQDLAVIPLLMLVAILGADSGDAVLVTVGKALLQAAVALGVIVVVGQLLMRPLFRLVAGTGSSELFIAAILFVIIATSLIAALADLSMALGAFVAGLLLAETEYRKAIEAAIKPFKGLLLGIFFFTVGMAIDVRELAREPILLVAGVVGLIALKAAVLGVLIRMHGQAWPVAIECGLLLGPGGEFAFVGIGLAVAHGIVATGTASFTLALTAISMGLIPILASLARRIARLLEPPPIADAALAVTPEPRSHHAIVVGYGRVGKVVTSLLARHGVAYTAIENDAASTSEDRRRGHSVYYGDATQAEFLQACGLREASAVIITVRSPSRIDAVVREVRKLRTDVPIFSRARDAEHARHLYRIGVSDAVPETIEASLQLSEAALVGLGIPTGPVIATIHEKRDEFREDLQQAARQAGLLQTRSLRERARRP